MPEKPLSVQEKSSHYSEPSLHSDETALETPIFDSTEDPEEYSGTPDCPDDDDILLPESEYSRPELEELERYRSFVWAYYLNSNLGDVRCDFSVEAAKLYGYEAGERLRLLREKYALHVSKAGCLMKAEGFDDKAGFEEAMRRIEKPVEIVWNPDKPFSFEECRTKRFEILLKLEFPQEYLWMVKCDPRERFETRWKGRAGKALLSESSAEPYVLSLSCDDLPHKAVGFSDFSEFRKACGILTEYARTSLPSGLEEAIDDLAPDLPRKWEYSPDETSAESWFLGLVYLGAKVRKLLYSEEILYIILKIQEKVKDRGAVSGIQTFKSDDGLSVICADDMRGSDGWRMLVDPGVEERA